MDNYGIDKDYLPKLLLGVIIGLIVVLCFVPLVVSSMANMAVADAAAQSLSDLNATSGNINATLDDIKSANLSSPVNNTTTNTATAQSETPTQSDTPSTPSVSNMKILSGSITTGSSLSSKSSCSVYVGQEYSGCKIQISVLYSRDGTDLNPGKLVSKTVDSSGYIHVNSANSFKLYPDDAVIRIYDTSGNMLDMYEVYLDTTSGTQSF